MTAITRLLRQTDPARDHGIVLDARAEDELEALIGTRLSPVRASARRVAPGSARRTRPVVVTGAVAVAVAVATIAVLIAPRSPQNDVGDTTPPPYPTPRASRLPLSALQLAERVWHVESATGESEDTWLRFAAHDVRVVRGSKSIEFGWRAQGSELLIRPDDPGLGTGRSVMVRWLETATSFRADKTGFELLDAQGRSTARLVATGTPPVAAVTIDSIVRDSLANAHPGPVRQTEPTALQGSWTLESGERTNARVTFKPDGTWTTTERCASARGSETVVGGYRLLTSGILLTTTQTGQAFACEEDPPAGATISIIGLLLQGRSTRVDGATATIYDSRGDVLGRLTRF